MGSPEAEPDRPDAAPATGPVSPEEPDTPETGAGRAAETGADTPTPVPTTTTPGRRAPPAGPALPLVPALAVLLVLLLAGTGSSGSPRPGSSGVATGDYVDALQAARAGIVDVASFDYLTLDDDITQIEAVTTGDLRTESVDQLNSRRQDITDAQAVVNNRGGRGRGGGPPTTPAPPCTWSSSRPRPAAPPSRPGPALPHRGRPHEDGGRWLLSGISGR